MKYTIFIVSILINFGALKIVFANENIIRKVQYLTTNCPKIEISDELKSSVTNHTITLVIVSKLPLVKTKFTSKKVIIDNIFSPNSLLI